MDAILAIDAGTTGLTALVVDATATIIARGYREFPQHFPADGWVEHDLEDIWASTLATVRRALREAGLRGSDVAAIGITNQRETTVLWEKATGKPVANAIVWQSRISAPVCERLKASGIHLPPDMFEGVTEVR